ncbi:outer membrane beta-barrel protein [Leeuwenhoekiella sp. A16]|uniref:outer membrane beta-barrel protein n=1 Tax=unclassified Leeuwenhoekiella TaxID=2615029 RepID=UPI003A800F94
MYKLYIAFCIFVYSISSTSAQEVLPRTLSEFDADQKLGDSRFSLVAGPEANFFIDETGKDLNSFGVGLGIGLQYEISNSLLIEGRYSFGITNKFNTMPDDYASRFNTFYISLIYRF